LEQSCGILHPVRLWRERLAARLVSAVLAMSLISAVVLISYEFREAARALDAQIDTMGHTLAGTVAANCAERVVLGEYPEIEDYADHVLRQSDVLVEYVRIESVDGKVLNPRNAPAETAIGADVRSFKAPVLMQPEGRLLGRVTIGLAVEPWRAQLRTRSMQTLLQNLGAFALMTIALALLLRSWLGRPLRDLDEAAQRIATGDLAAPVPPTGVGELRRLAFTLEGMRCNLQESQASLRAQNERLRELDRLKDEFLANTSHEIRTPLGQILNGIELLQETTGAERDEVIAGMQRNGKHLLFLLNQILDFSKLQAGNVQVQAQDVPLRPLLEDVLACAAPEARAKGLACELRLLASASHAAHADPFLLRQILVNLVGNAIKFTNRGGIRVRVTPCHRRTNRLRLIVTDTGPGISEQVQRRLFQPFQQGDASLTRQHGGTGLGLAISRQLARAMGGEIQLSSRLGKGTRVVVTLPLGTAPAVEKPAATTTTILAAPSSASTAPAGDETLPRKRILLVDDAPDNRRLLSAILRKAGAEVETAEDGAQGCDAVAKADSGGDPFDIVIMDIQMPVLDGQQAARRLRSGGCRLPLIALTAHATEHDRKACIDAGFDDYATKPISKAQLTQLLKRHLRSHG
jgi:signal transduction histidine kinase/CheY-like chemotaxis protein